MITTVDITAMTQILRDQKVTITHMGFLRKTIHRPVTIQKDLLGDGCYLQHQHVSILRTICLQIQNYLNSLRRFPVSKCFFVTWISNKTFLDECC